MSSLNNPSSRLLPEDCRLIVGVMSGTSADGVDVAICRLPVRVEEKGSWGELLWHQAVPYSSDLRGHIHDIRRLGACTLAELAGLTRRITLEHAGAIWVALSNASITLGPDDAIADHGQTLFHAPPLTMQVLDPALLAWELSCQVVSDFRRADCAAGGQGAPLVPYADWRLFRSNEKGRALVNLGGIANVTLLLPGASPTQLLAFDTGPANCLSDHLCRTHDPSGPGFDAAGALAAKGRADESVVARFLKSLYFGKLPPKSTDGPAMISLFEAAGGLNLGFHDALATAAECVARSVAEAILSHGTHVDEVILSGGGVYHGPVVRRLTTQLEQAGASVLSTDQLGVPSGAKEAIAFALLAQATLDGKPANMPSCTGAERGVVLGTLTPKP